MSKLCTSKIHRLENACCAKSQMSGERHRVFIRLVACIVPKKKKLTLFGCTQQIKNAVTANDSKLPFSPDIFNLPFDSFLFVSMRKSFSWILLFLSRFGLRRKCSGNKTRLWRGICECLGHENSTCINKGLLCFQTFYTKSPSMRLLHKIRFLVNKANILNPADMKFINFNKGVVKCSFLRLINDSFAVFAKYCWSAEPFIERKHVCNYSR